MEHPGRVFSREQLARFGLGATMSISRLRTVDVHIRRLRKAMNCRTDDLIRTVRAAGYALDINAQTSPNAAKRVFRRLARQAQRLGDRAMGHVPREHIQARPEMRIRLQRCPIALIRQRQHDRAAWRCSAPPSKSAPQPAGIFATQ